MSPAETKQIAERFIVETWNNGNLGELSRFVTSDFIYHTRGEDVTGMKDFKEWAFSDRDIFPDICLTIVDSIVVYYLAYFDRI